VSESRDPTGRFRQAGEILTWHRVKSGDVSRTDRLCLAGSAQNEDARPKAGGSRPPGVTQAQEDGKRRPTRYAQADSELSLLFIPFSLIAKDLRVSRFGCRSATMLPHRFRTEA
jgi:hypothetical protein